MKKQTVGALALSAALAMGMAGTAFADPAAVVQGNATDNASDTAIENTQADGKNTGVGSGNTEVYLQAVTNQVNATIPLRVYAVADIYGGDMVMPSAASYKITNNSTAGTLYVTQVQAALDNAGAINGWTGVATKEALATTSAEKAVFVSMQPAGIAAPWALTSGDSTTKVLSPATATGAASANYLWEVAKKSGDAGTESAIQLVGANSALGANIDTSMTYENGSAVKFMNITYTVSMKAHEMTAGTTAG